MLGTLWDYLCREVWPRRCELPRTSEFVIALAAGLAIALAAPGLPASTHLGDVLTIVLAYAAIAFGFSIAGLTVALTLPDARFVHRIATAKPESEKLRRIRDRGHRDPNAYSDLLFVYSWTAAWHWVVLVLGFTELAIYGAGRRVAGPGVDAATRVLDGLLVFATVYAVLLFLVTLITLSQAGNLYVKELSERDPPET